MIRLHLKWLLKHNIVVLVLCLLTTGIVYAGDVSYTIVDEKISDKPIKTQIVQNIVISGTPTKSELEAEILKRYRTALARRGFEYHNPATNIFIYFYATAHQARNNQSKWIGMIAMGPSDKGEPEVVINEYRLDQLSQAPQESLGLSEKERKQVFRDIAAAEDKATREARARVPDSEVMKQIDLERELGEKYKAKIAQQYNLASDQLVEIISEGVKKGW